MGVCSFNLYLSVEYSYNFIIAVTNAGVDEFTGVAYAVESAFEFELVILLCVVRVLGAMGVVGKELGTILVMNKVLFLYLPLSVGFYFFGSTTY